MVRFFSRIYSVSNLVSRRTCFYMSWKKGQDNFLSKCIKNQSKDVSYGIYDSDSGDVGSNSNSSHFTDAVGSGIKNAVDLEKLSEEEKEIYYIHKAACQEGKSMYNDPATGYAVFTETFHRQRGNCCGNACRHIPASVSPHKMDYTNKVGVHVFLAPAEPLTRRASLIMAQSFIN